MILLVAPFAVLVAAHYLFRYAYYGEWLPNTYYAKHVRPWYESGFRYLYSRRAGDRAVSAAAARVAGADAHAGRCISDGSFRSPPSLCRHPHGLSAANWRRPISSIDPSTSTGLCWRSPQLKASLCSAQRISTALRSVPANPGLGDPGEETYIDRALPARAVLRQRDSETPCFSRGPP